ncbi:uncharacterized protein TNCV_5127301 [Trichonephila clavipes]|nr:uncharacterized protein TNCV_5127301 [Trichonephila clavipes]
MAPHKPRKSSPIQDTDDEDMIVYDMEEQIETPKKNDKYFLSEEYWKNESWRQEGFLHMTPTRLNSPTQGKRTLRWAAKQQCREVLCCKDSFENSGKLRAGVLVDILRILTENLYVNCMIQSAALPLMNITQRGDFQQDNMLSPYAVATQHSLQNVDMLPGPARFTIIFQSSTNGSSLDGHSSTIHNQN